jgi:hypothetical protein
MENLVVMPGSARFDLQILESVSGEFGWPVKVLNGQPDVAEAQQHGASAGVLFYRDALGPGCSWLDAIRILRVALPGVHLVACHGFTEAFDWPKLCDAGAFHALWLPLKEDEVRKSLGFISEARKKSLSRAPDRPVRHAGLA